MLCDDARTVQPVPQPSPPCTACTAIPSALPYHLLYCLRHGTRFSRGGIPEEWLDAWRAAGLEAAASAAALPTGDVLGGPPNTVVVGWVNL